MTATTSRPRRLFELEVLDGGAAARLRLARDEHGLDGVALERAFARLLGAGVERIVADLSDVDEIDAHTVAVLRRLQSVAAGADTCFNIDLGSGRLPLEPSRLLFNELQQLWLERAIEALTISGILDISQLEQQVEGVLERWARTPSLTEGSRRQARQQALNARRQRLIAEAMRDRAASQRRRIERWRSASGHANSLGSLDAGYEALAEAFAIGRIEQEL